MGSHGLQYNYQTFLELQVLFKNIIIEYSTVIRENLGKF